MRHPHRRRSGLEHAVAAHLEQSRRRQQLVNGFIEGYRREHPELAAEHSPGEVEELAADALGGLLDRRLTQRLADGFGALQESEQEGTTT
jgi:hypothetical protein